MKRISSLIDKVKDKDRDPANRPPGSATSSTGTQHRPPPTSPTSANPPGGHAQSFFNPPSGPPPSHPSYQAQQPGSHSGGYPPPNPQAYPPSSNQYAAPSGPPPSFAAQQGAAYPPPGSQPYQAPSGPPPNVFAGATHPGAAVGANGGAALGSALAGRENELAQLKRYDTVILVDDSESMEMFWDETRDALMGVVETASKYDSDGVDLYFFNSTRVAQNVADPSGIRQLFRQVEPRKSTPTLDAMSRVLLPYVDNLEKSRRAKPLNLICLTDGAPNRGQDPEPLLVDVAKRLDAGRFPAFQIGIQFIQIGQDDEATVALQNLDDGLKTKHGIRDYVDVTPYEPARAMTAEYMLKVMLGGISRKYDAQTV